MMNGMLSKVRFFLISEDGPTAVEYAVMLALIIATCITSVRSLGAYVTGMFSTANQTIGS